MPEAASSKRGRSGLQGYPEPANCQSVACFHILLFFLLAMLCDMCCPATARLLAARQVLRGAFSSGC